MNKKIQKPAVIVERITDGVDTNNFGVMFHSTKSIESFQQRSGMSGAYTTEYQHHYIALIARLNAGAQTLDLCIPLCMFNYHQEVAGASVEFNLAEVSTANADAQELAMKKFKEFEQTEMYKTILSMGFTEFIIEGMHSIHAHPNGINRFSGTDLRENINHPGVNFPLNTGTNVANFASIIQHKEGFAQIIHTEYRMFNGVELGEREYKKGRTLSVVRGYDVPEPEPYVIPEPGLIDALFGTKPVAPPKPLPEKKRANYCLRDGFIGAEEATISKLEKEMMDMWVNCPFEIDTSLVLKTNVLKGRGRLLAPVTKFKNEQVNGKGKKKAEEINAGLFGTWGKTDGKTEPSFNQKKEFLKTRGFTEKDFLVLRIEEVCDEYTYEIHAKEQEEQAGTEPTLNSMKQYLVDSEAFTWLDFQNIEDEEIKNFYWLERLDEIEDEQAGIEYEEAETSQEDMISYLINTGFTVFELKNMDESEIKEAYELNFRFEMEIETQLPATEKEETIELPSEAKMKEYLCNIGMSEARVNSMYPDVLLDTYLINRSKAGLEPSDDEQDNHFSRAQMENLLVGDNIVSDAKLKTLSNEKVLLMFNDVYELTDEDYKNA